MAEAFEQEEAPINIPVFPIEIEIDRPALTLHVRGDQHIGLKGINIEEMKLAYKREQDQHRGNILVIDTGDLIENALKSSIGHNYDIGIPDPAEQLILAKELIEDCDSHLYGPSYASISPITKRNTKHCRHIGFVGNHEYRSRKTAGIWLNKELYSGKGVLDGHIQAILKVTLINKKLKLRRTYRIHCAHRLTNTSASISSVTLFRGFQKKKSDIEADIFVCGHYHKRFIETDIKYDQEGQHKKLLFVCNPSPVGQVEYASWSLYSPIESAYYTNAYLPIEPNLRPWGKK